MSDFDDQRADFAEVLPSRRSNAPLIMAAVLAALLALLIGIWFAWSPLMAMLSPQLPAAADAEVVELLDTLIRQSSAGQLATSIDGHREISYDADDQIRVGSCVVHTDYGDLEVGYQVQWQDRPKGEFLVTILDKGLPSCTSPEVKHLLVSIIAPTPLGATMKSIDGHRELSHDAEAEIRHGQCVVHTNDGPVEVAYFVAWQNRERREFLVQIPPPPLPLCDSDPVVRVLEQVIRGLPDLKVVSIDGHREVRYDAEADVRYGRCTVHTDQGDREMPFFVEWLSKDAGEFAVQIPSAELPECDSPAVKQVLQQVLQESPIGPRVASIGGHREISYDAETPVRLGRCEVQTTDGKALSFAYQVEWQDRDRGQFQVQVFEK